MDKKEDLEIALNEWYENQEKKKKMLLKKYPPNPPNSVCNHAFVKGLSIENSFNPAVGEYNFLFKVQDEKIFVWTHTQDNNSALIIEANEKIKEMIFWKNILSVIELSFSYIEAFENGLATDNSLKYKWIYYFEPQTTKIDEAVFYNISEIDQKFITNGRIIKATQLAHMAPILELLLRDDKAFVAVSMLKLSFEMHYICLICELSEYPYHDHLTFEPEIWEHASLIPNMEAAIVQACRSVESILGEPPNKDKKSAVFRHKEKWILSIGIDPDSLFETGKKTYLEFYYNLFFELRNPSAHSYGKIQFDLERSKTIQAQCFAALIIRAYITKNSLNLEDAQTELGFNHAFLNRIPENRSTSLTK